MNLPNFEFFEPFNKLRQNMKAPLLDSFLLKHKRESLTMAELDILINKGMDVDLKQITVLNDATLAYKDSRVLLYIRDIPIYDQGHYSDNNYLPKFHIAWCETLDKMKNKNKFGKYVISTKMDGNFEIFKIENSKKKHSIEKLSVCKNCLKKISFENYNNISSIKKNEIFNKFSIENFFEQFPKQFFLNKPQYNNFTAPINTYTDNFYEIGKDLKEKLNWKCQECNLQFSEKDRKKFLHTHHINGLKYDNKLENLKILCANCHAHEENHGHMKNLINQNI